MSRSPGGLFDGEPPKLPTRVAAQVAWSSIKVRLSRSLVTVSSVVLAVTFLLVVLGGEIGSRAVYASWAQDVQASQDVNLLRRLSTQPRSPLVLIESLHKNGPTTTAWATDLGHTVPSFTEDLPARALILAEWIKEIKPSQRYLVTRNTPTSDWLLAFTSGVQAEELTTLAATFKGTRLPFGPNELTQLAQEMSALANAVVVLQSAEKSRLQQVKTAGGSTEVLAAIRQNLPIADATAKGLPVAQLLGSVDDGRYQKLVLQLEIDALRADAQAILSKPRTYSETGADGSEKTFSAETMSLSALVDGIDKTHPLADTIEGELRAAISAEGLDRIRDRIVEQRRLDSLAATFDSLGFDPEAGIERTAWLVLLSLLVCIVGIVNSMMMAVTERFREIATMKCLGAVDGFILKAFMIESGSVGLVGAILGAIVGVIMVMIQATFRFGTTFWTAFPAAWLALAALAALVCGLILTIMGALLPAYKAARMHPIEAMRLDA